MTRWKLRWSKKAARQTHDLDNDLWLVLMEEVDRCRINPFRVPTGWLNPSGTLRCIGVGHLEVRYQLRPKVREMVVTSVEEASGEREGAQVPEPGWF